MSEALPEERAPKIEFWQGAKAKEAKESVPSATDANATTERSSRLKGEKEGGVRSEPHVDDS